MTIRKLGRLPTKHDPRTLHLSRYMLEGLPPPPAAVDWMDKIGDWGMMGNDSVGDCTCACAGHEIEAWTAYASSEAVISTADVLAAYSAITGYDPSDPNTDQGAACLDVLKYWRTTGIGGHKIGAFVAVDPKSELQIKLACYLFGSVYLGVDLPVSAQSQDVWDVPEGGPVGDGAPGSWGGHAIPIQAYDLTGETVITWGSKQRMTPAFLATYCSEAYAILSQDFIAAGKAPNGFDLATLTTDLAALPSAPAPAPAAYKAVKVPSHSTGFDTTAKLTPAICAAAKAAGCAFVVRYLGSVTAAEIATITAAGLGVMFVTYPPQKSGWVPIASDGAARGAAAVAQLKALGVPAGATVWTDLEGCKGPAGPTIAWCNAAFAPIAAAGWQAGLYCGVPLGGLTATDLYHLKCSAYWRSCSRGVPEPAEVGFCCAQEYRPNVSAFGTVVDFDRAFEDFANRLPTMIVHA